LSGRSRAEITEAILRVVAAGYGRKMRMMYGAYLSYAQLEEYADFMIKSGLVYMEVGRGCTGSRSREKPSSTGPGALRHRESQ